ncbi:AraC family transcriptional regulator [Vreelandella titanicae]|uniref:AraC family transcriptional regulator n=1 Tax=Halomonadaceae TaxID=28256 RepID=UPI000481B4E5|nr:MULTISPECIES: AraC family transcriptional regulator [Halomonas]NAO96490.1 helix-turn-helix domain-containing protein [Halomonas sp. MG34]PKH63622.1 AraC family transcriptional regulator [Halomonas sp. Choline-3u-9]QGQ69703.1 helix-turn-helix transcriptional regulator [Halomonas sp. PA16-9]
MKYPEIGLHIRTYDDEVKSHSHDHHQLVLPLVGTLFLSVDSMAGEVAQHRAAIIPSGSGHGFAATEDNRFLVADLPEGLAPALDKLPCFVELDSALRHYVQFLHAQVMSGAGADATQHHMLLLLLQLLQERHGSQLKLDRRVHAAQQFLDDHFHQPISMAEVANVAHLSIRQLNDLFRHQVGVTPHQYLTEVRMKEAVRLLEQSGLSVQRVADAVGYSSLSAFSDRFRRHFGKPPSHFRRLST